MLHLFQTPIFVENKHFNWYKSTKMFLKGNNAQRTNSDAIGKYLNIIDCLKEKTNWLLQFFDVLNENIVYFSRVPTFKIFNFYLSPFFQRRTQLTPWF